MIPATPTRLLIFSVSAWLALIVSSLANAQERFLIEGILDAEVYKTNDDSFSLSRNDGDVSYLGRLQLWSAWQMTSNLQLYAMGEIETENEYGYRNTDSELTQLALRYSSNSSPFYYIEAGKILPPIAVATDRRLSTQNPLIAEPNIIYAPYPLGILVAGSFGWFDYRAALVDLPAILPEYLPADPSSSYRPDLGIGVSPMAGLRFGLAYTKGPYLNKQQGERLPEGSDWKDFDQRLWALEVEFSRGYLEFTSELVFSSYDIPFQYERTDFTEYFLELKYTWTPRFYGALRYQKYGYPNISYPGNPAGLAPKTILYDFEIGLGYRFTANTQLKLAYQQDRWSIEYVPDYYYPDGRSIALQLSYHFDLGSLFGRDW